jgi:hypothetical protein
MKIATVTALHGRDSDEYSKIENAINTLTDFQEFLKNNSVDMSKIDENTLCVFRRQLQRLFSPKGLVIDWVDND